MKDFYITESWISDEVFNLLRASLGSTKKDYWSNLLTFDLNLDLFGIRVKNIECGYPKSKLTVLIRTKKRNMVLNKIYEKFLKHYMLMLSYFQSELLDILEIINNAQIQPEVRVSERSEPNLNTSIRSEIPSRKLTMEEERDLAAGKSLSSILNTVEDRPLPSNRPKKPRVTEQLTLSELDAFKQIQNFLSSKKYVMSEEHIVRFLRAKEFQIKNTEEVLEKLFTWRAEIGFDRLNLQDPDFDIYIKAKILQVIGHDKGGRPVVYFIGARYFPAKSPEMNFRRYFVALLNHLVATFREGAEQYVFLLDNKDLKSENTSMSSLKEAVPIMQNYYPDYMHKLVLLNANFLTRSVFMAIKPFLHPHTQKKIAVASSDTGEVYKLLSEFLDHNTIPTQFGGGKLVE
jgi:hypothetical protein